MRNWEGWRYMYGSDGKPAWFDHYLAYLWLFLSGTRISWGHRDFDRGPKTFQLLKNIGKNLDLLINSGSAFKWQVLSQGQVLSV